MIVCSGSLAAFVRNARLLSRFATALFTLPLLLALPGRAGAQTTTSYTGGAISISGTCGSAINSPSIGTSCNTSSGYGHSTATVSAAGTITHVQVTLSTVKSGYALTGNPNDSVAYTSFYLASPSGQMFQLLGCTGDGTDGDDAGDSGSVLNGVNITVADNESSLAPLLSPWPNTGSPSVKPSSYWLNSNGACGYSSLPANAEGLTLPSSDGSSLLDNTFSASSMTGGWTLYMATDDPFLSGGGVDPVSIGSWTLQLTYTAAVNASTNTTIASSADPATAGNVTFTATVTSTSTVNTGNVTFTGNGANLSCGSGGVVPVSNGVAQCTAPLAQGLYSVEASYGGGTGFNGSNASMNQLMEGVTTPPGSGSTTWCNNGSITIPALSTGTAYPAIITVSGYPAGTTVSSVQVTLNGVYGQGGVFAQHLLVAPTNSYNLDFLDGAWDNAVNSPGVNLTMVDSAGQYPDWPSQTNNAASGSYEASDELSSASNDTFPSSSAPGIDTAIPQVPSANPNSNPKTNSPGTINYGYDPVFSGEEGPITNTFENMFSGAPANGDWALYVYENNSPYSEVISGGWCVDLTLNTGTSTTTTLNSGQNPQAAQQSVNLTATVTSGGNPVTSGGTVTFLDDGATPSGNSSNKVTLNSSGQATFATGTTSYSLQTGVSGTSDVFTTISEGDHNFTAEYGGSTTDNPSNSATFWQRFDNASSAPTFSGSNTYAYCNAGPVVQVPNGIGAFLPNPSNVFVTNLPGTVNTAGVTLKGLYSGAGTSASTQSLLEGPTGAALDFFSNTGNNTTTFSTGNYTFSDSGGSLVPSSSSFSPGTYKPTAYGSTADSFTSSSSGLYNKPSSFSYAAPHGASTFSSTFGGTGSGNGTWSLFFNMSSLVNYTGAANGWCVNLTENPVSITTTLGHSGTGPSGDFVQGESGASINVNVENDGTGTAGDPAGSNANPLTVTDALPSGLTYSSFSGTGWSCSAAGQNVTCTNDSASIAQDSNYPALTIGVNVATNAGSPLSNAISVSGATTSGSTGSDSITVDPPPALAVTVGHTGNFTQGQNAVWNITVSNTASGGATNGTITVNDSLPTGYTLVSSSSTGNNFGCGATANLVTCTSSTAISGGSNNLIALTVGVPATSPTSVSDMASAYGGGDPVHTSPGTAAISNTDTVTVIQVPATVTLTTGNNQSATVATAFASPLVVTVADANNIPINGQSVTFSAPGSGPSGIFSNSAPTIAGTTNSSGQLTEAFTANIFAGTYLVSAQAGSILNSFSLTNLAGLPANVLIVSGNGQTANDTTAFTNPMTVSVSDAYGNPVPSATVLFTPPSSGASLTFAGGMNAATTNLSGIATSAAMTANNQVGTYSVFASSGTGSTNFTFTNALGPFTQLGVTAPSSAYVGIPIQFTVNAQDAGGNVVGTVNDTLQFTSSDTAASLPAPTALVNGTGTFAATLNTLGPETISAFDSTASILGTSGTITVSPVPTLVVTVNTDDSGNAADCTPQASSVSGSDASCSLRDALLESASLGAANIYFDSTKFTSPTTIAETNGTMAIPANSSILGLPSGASITVQGGSTGPVFSLASGLTGSIANLTITGASGTNGSGIGNSGGTLTLSNSTISNNSAISGGGINSSGGTLTITNSTISGNQATGSGGAGISVGGGTVSITNSTISGNASTTGGGISIASGVVAITNSTVVNNTANQSGGGIAVGGGTLTLSNTTLSGNQASLTLGAGGGIYVATGSVNMVYSTLNNNSANGGGGLFNQSGTVTITNSTFSGDTAGTSGGGGIGNGSGNLTLNNSIVAGNTAPADSDVFGAFESISANNLIGDGTGMSGITNGSNGNQVGSLSSPINPRLTAIGNYGGPTQTMIPSPSSGAVCGGSISLVPNSITTDQRGFPNTNNTYPGFISGPACMDIGAVQTAYALNFSTQPGTPQYSGLAFPAAVTLSESGLTFTGASETIALALEGGSVTSFTGNSAATSGGVASYSLTLINATGVSGLQLGATLSGGLAAPATSNPFDLDEAALATLTSPAPGSVFTGPEMTFTWSTANPNATSYSFRLGTTKGANNLYASGQTTSTSVTVPNLPTNGEKIYARVYTYFGSTPMYTDFVFTAAAAAALTSPTSTTLPAGQTVKFTWSASTPSGSYNLRLGTTQGANDLYASGVTTNTSVTVPNLPTNGEKVYARLYTHFGSAQVYTDYVFNAVNAAVLTSPAPSSVFPSPEVTFTWSAATGNINYSFRLGTTPGAGDVFESNVTTNTSVTVPNLPTNGETIYARLYTYFASGEVYADYAFTATTATLAALTSPTPGSVFTSPEVTFTWSAANPSAQYSLRLGTTPGANNVFASNVISGTSVTVPNLPTNGETIYARLFTYFGSNHAHAHVDYVFTATTATLAALTSPTPGTVLAGKTVTFTWSAANPSAQYSLRLGTTPGGNDVFASNVTSNTSVTAHNLPTNGETIYARLYTYFGSNEAHAHIDYVFTAAP